MPCRSLRFTSVFGRLTLMQLEPVMRRRKNILCDTSWLHSFGAIELIVKHFGAERLVFGTGSKSHNGAAMGALARADITAAQRRQIAHGNLDRLTGLNATPASTSRWTANTLWPRFLEGKPLGVDVVDAHGHLGPSAGYVMEAQEERQQLKAGLKVMNKTASKPCWFRDFRHSWKPFCAPTPIVCWVTLDSIPFMPTN